MSQQHQLLLTPEKPAAGQNRLNQPCTCPLSLRDRPRTPHCLQAPLLLPLPTLLSPAVTRGQEGGSGVAATAQSASWKALAGDLTTTMSLTGHAGHGRWRTSTLSTKHPIGWRLSLGSPIWFVYLLVFMSRHFLFLLSLRGLKLWRLDTA